MPTNDQEHAQSGKRDERNNRRHSESADRDPVGNVNDVIRGAGIEGELDVLSIDVDGNDYWIWEGPQCVSARIGVIEVHTEYRLHDVLAPYRADFDWRQLGEGEPIGASPVAMTRLAERLGYRLVGGNRYGFNAFYVRNDLAEGVVSTVGVDELLGHDWSREPNEWSAER